MDYIGEVCSVCEKTFCKGDNIVVCPDCGTPHHRECYELSGHCINEVKHYNDYSWASEKEDDKNSETSGKKVVCKLCHSVNSDDALFCNKCGAPLSIETSNNTNNTNGNPQQAPFGFSANSFVTQTTTIDKNTDLGEGVTADEVAKFVDKSVPYYVTIFARIKNLNASRFNFAAFLFNGGWFIYRKQYLKGIIFSAIIALCLISTAFFSPQYTSIMSNITNTISNADKNVNTYALLWSEIFSLPIEKAIAFWCVQIADIARYVVMVVSGLTANRSYYKHSIKSINEIKEKKLTKEQTDKAIVEKGGLNNPVAICLFICYLIITLVPQFL